MTERLYRHPTDRAIAGVAGGLATWLNIDPSLVRIAWVLLAVFTGGAFVLVYIVMMIVVPLAPTGWTPRPRDAGWGPPPGGWGSPGPSTWGPTAAPGGAPSTPPAWGEPVPAAWVVPAAPGAGQPGADPSGATVAGASPGQAPAWSSTPDGGQTPGWGTSTAPTQPWSPPKPGNAGIVAGVVLVVVGVWFLIDQLVTIDWDLLWPIAIMVLGGGLIAGALVRSRDT